METARSVTTNSVVSVSPDASLWDVLRLWVQENAHGAPVVDEDGQFVGVITTSALLQAQEHEHDTAPAVRDDLREALEFSLARGSRDLTDFLDRLAQRSVAEVMTTDFLSVDCDTRLADIARCLRENQVHRVWVEEEGRLCGVVSALDRMPIIERGGAMG